MTDRHFIADDGTSDAGDFPHSADFAFRQGVAVHGFMPALQALFSVLNETNQDRVLGQLGFKRGDLAENTGQQPGKQPVVGAQGATPVHFPVEKLCELCERAFFAIGTTGANADVHHQHRELWEELRAVRDAISADVPEYLGGSQQSALAAAARDEVASADAELSHVAQWHELSGRAKNFALMLNYTSSEFVLRDPAQQCIGRYKSFYDLRAGISDWVATQRRAGVKI